MPVNYVGNIGKTRAVQQAAERFEYLRMQAGEAVAQYDTLFIDGEYVRQANARGTTRIPAMGMALTSSLSGGILDVITRGLVSNGAWDFTSNAILFLSPLSNGLMTNTAPTASGDQTQRLGRSRTPDSVDFQPEDTYIAIAG